MDLIRKLIAEEFTLLNVDEKKSPHIMGKEWEKQTFKQLKSKYNMNSKLWGMRMGKQENGRYIMSLDFDACGQADVKTKKRLGCEYTKKKLDEYIEIADMQDGDDGYDGFFDSSTDGNANVLVDYTDAPEIRKMVEEIGSKFKVYELEVLLGNGHQQVIPPSLTECKIRGEKWRPREFANDKPFYILTEQSPIYEFVLGLFADKNNGIGQGKETPKKNTQIKTETKKEMKSEPTAIIETDDEYLDLLFNVIKNEVIDREKVIDWDTYFHIAGILKTNGYDLQVFLKWANVEGFCKQGDDWALWKGISPSKSMSIYGLQNIAKRINPVGYDEWIRKYGKYISIETLVNGENDIAKEIADQLIISLVFTKTNRWYTFDEKTKLWRVLNNPYAVVISHIQSKIDESRRMTLNFKEKTQDADEKAKYEKAIQVYTGHYSKVSNGGFQNTISKILTTYLFDGDFEQKLDTIPYKIAYRNGIMDLRTLVFRTGLKSSDYLTKTIPYDYEKSTDEHRNKVRQELLKICNVNEKQLEYYLSVFGSALTGDASKIQEFWNLRGQKASNGKSVILEALTAILPTYVKSIDTNIMELNHGSRHKEIAGWRGARVLWGNEMTSKKQDGEFMKVLTDGTTLEYKVMYGTTDDMPITFKLFFISNNTMNVNCDAGVKRRLRMMQFDSKFLDDIVDNYEKHEFKKDKTFKDKLTTTYKFALMDLLFSYSKMFLDDGYNLKPTPVEWKAEAEEVAQDNNEFYDFIETYYEFETGVKTLKKDIEALWSSAKCKIDLRTFKDALRGLGKDFQHDSKEYIKGVGRGFWTGIKIRPPEKIVEKIEEE